MLSLCYYIYMNEFKIYRDNQYDLKENIKIKFNSRVLPAILKVDDYFVNH